ncbi:hypothetical protein L873DRAFT_1830315 [Choiromyces venosus 120613-1]|uniref:Myb-like domain-containing protein n=1 Tax=Choiromyces venosus 120613-1 TaxID=1336337 RepID=A0A3N4J8H4_9PEZI|nr:hypothetical protein L873DRAFT_1830315 [Choiromyces venosus 120613-1]
MVTLIPQPTQQRRPPVIVSSETEESEPETISKAQATSGPGTSSPALELESANSASQPSSPKTALSPASEDSDELGKIEQSELHPVKISDYNRPELDWSSASESDGAGSGFESGDSGRIRGNSRFTPLEELVPVVAPTPPSLSDEDNESNIGSQSDGYVDGNHGDDGRDEHGGDEEGEGEEEHEEPTEEASPRAHSLGLTDDNGDHGITDLPQTGEAAPQISETEDEAENDDGSDDDDDGGDDDNYQKSDTEPSLPNSPGNEVVSSPLNAGDPTENTEDEPRKKPGRNRDYIPGRKRGKQIDRFNPEYVKELNDAISSANSRELCPRGLQLLRGSWVIGSWWTHTEKHQFFNLIARIGRHDVAALARNMKTKSIVECRAYLKLLRQAVVDSNENMLYRAWRLPRMTDIPAAVEISDECAEALEEEAQLLENRTVVDEQRGEKHKWGKFWLLDGDTAEHIEDLYEDYETGYDEDGLQKLQDFAPEADIFMNGPEENWQTLGDKRPSIRYTAFIDIHTLVVSITRRLVSASIFMAQSRLKSTDSRILKSSKESDVRPSDVEAATKTLGFVPNTNEYWTKLPRRLGLDVLEDRFYVLNGRKNIITPLDEVERFMRSKENFRTRPVTKTESGASDQEESSQNEDDEEEEAETTHNTSDHPDEAEGSNDSDSSTIEADSSEDDDFIVLNPDIHHESNKTRKRLDRQYQEHLDREEAYLESRDKRESQEEEQRLWQLLGKQPPEEEKEGEEEKEEKEDEVLPLPMARRKRPAEIHDWADDVEYYAHWEINRKKRRKMMKMRGVENVEVVVGGGEEEEGGGSGRKLTAISEAERARLRRLAGAPSSPSNSSGYTSALESIPVESGAEEADNESEE